MSCKHHLGTLWFYLCVLFCFVFEFDGLRGLQSWLKDLRLEMCFLAVNAAGRLREGGCRTLIGVAEGRALGVCGEKIRGWMCGWEAGWGGRDQEKGGVMTAVVACSLQSSDNQADLCLTSLSACPRHFPLQLLDALLNWTAAVSTEWCSDVL